MKTHTALERAAFLKLCLRPMLWLVLVSSLPASLYWLFGGGFGVALGLIILLMAGGSLACLALFLWVVSLQRTYSRYLLALYGLPLGGLAAARALGELVGQERFLVQVGILVALGLTPFAPAGRLLYGEVSARSFHLTGGALAVITVAVFLTPDRFWLVMPRIPAFVWAVPLMATLLTAAITIRLGGAHVGQEGPVEH